MGCPKRIGNLTSSGEGPQTWHHQSVIPSFLKDGHLTMDHRQPELGRPGLCRADLAVRLRGEILRGPRNASSAGACCDLCRSIHACQGWTMTGTEGSVLTHISGQYDPCASCISGQDVGWITKRAGSNTSSE